MERKEFPSPYLDFINKFPYPPIPSKDYPVDKEKAEQWAEAFCMPWVVRKHKLIAQHIEYIDWKTFREYLDRAWQKFSYYIRDKPWIAYIGSDKGEFVDRSPFWIFRLLYPTMKNKPIKIVGTMSELFDAIDDLKDYKVREIAFFDDVIYSGNHFGDIIQNLFYTSSCDHINMIKKLRYSLVCVAISNIGLKKIQSIYREFDPKMWVKVFTAHHIVNIGKQIGFEYFYGRDSEKMLLYLPYKIPDDTSVLHNDLIGVVPKIESAYRKKCPQRMKEQIIPYIKGCEKDHKQGKTCPESVYKSKEAKESYKTLQYLRQKQQEEKSKETHAIH